MYVSDSLSVLVLVFFGVDFILFCFGFFFLLATLSQLASSSYLISSLLKDARLSRHHPFLFLLLS